MDIVKVRDASDVVGCRPHRSMGVKHDLNLFFVFPGVKAKGVRKWGNKFTANPPMTVDNGHSHNYRM